MAQIVHGIVDIDGTLTADRPGSPQLGVAYLNNNALFEVFREGLMRLGRSRDAASAELLRYVDSNVFWDYDGIIAAFALPPQETWAALREWHARNLEVFADGVRMLRALRRTGMALSICSNNPRTGCLLKLERAGLATVDSAAPFQSIMCSNSIRGQKSAPHWWPRVLAECGAPPEHVVVIGDNPVEDMALPRAAGFRHFCIVDRRQTEPCRHADGVITVSSLDHVPAIIAAGMDPAVCDRLPEVS